MAVVEGLRDGRAIWRQTAIPVIFRRAKSVPLLVKLPDAEDNREWLRNGSQRIPRWNVRYKCWEVPHAWLNPLVKRLAGVYWEGGWDTGK